MEYNNTNRHNHITGKIFFYRIKKINTLFWRGNSNLYGWSIHDEDYYESVDTEHYFEADFMIYGYKVLTEKNKQLKQTKV
jgi:hypothetical protein